MSRQVAEARRFYLPPQGRPTRATALYCGWERTAPDYRIDRPGFRYYGLEFVAGGQGTLWINQREHALRRGSMFAYGPGIQHRITTDPGDRLSKYFVDVAGRGAAASLQAAGIAPGTCCMLLSAEEVQTTFEHLLEAARRGTAAAGRVAGLYFEIILQLASETQQPSGTVRERSRQTFVRCRDYLERNFLQTATAEQAAKACGIAPAYLSRIFRKFTGRAPYQFLIRLKMNHAAALLDQQPITVGDVAETLGMDPFHFSRVFKRVHGTAPLHFVAGRNAPARGNAGRTQ